MELGFTVAAGPLSQISVSLFSVELAVQLAHGAYGWWKARDRAQSLSLLVESKGSQISATSTFNLFLYRDKRKDGFIRGVARGPDGVLSCVTLPKASTASSGDVGLVCLRAVVCALLCFYNASTVLDILVRVLPGTLYNSNQEGGDEKIDGPLLSCLREYVKAAAVEEDSDDLRQKLQATVDSKLASVTGAPLADVFECDDFLESDAPNFIGAMRWILTPVVKRTPLVYPTRSLKVWALAVIMNKLGFQVEASANAISSKSDYENYVENVGYQSTDQEIILVTSNAGSTDPLSGGVQKMSTSAKPRVGSIRSIPWIAFRHLSDSQSCANTKHLSEIWEFTFDYVLNILEPPPQIELSYGRQTEIKFTKAAISSFGSLFSYKASNSMLDRKLQWLTFAIFKPLQKFLPSTSDNDRIWARTNTVGQFQGLSKEYLDLPKGNDADDWYITRAIALAAIYAICTRWLSPDDNEAHMLDTEVAFSPDFIRRGNLASWTSFECFSSILFPENIPISDDAQWGFGASMAHSDWLHLLYMVFSGTSKDSGMQPRLPSSRGEPPNRTVLGFQKNGVVLVPELLLHPSPDPESWFRYHLRVGQLLDMPLDEDGFICHAKMVPSDSKFSETWEYGLTGQCTLLVDRQLPDMVVRLDTEPWWEFDERAVVFRARVGGVVKAIFNPEFLYKRCLTPLKSRCTCATPKDSVELKETVMVMHVSDVLSNHSKEMVYRHNSANPWERKPIIVQTGGDPILQVLCLALTHTKRSQVVVGCLDGLATEQLNEFNFL